MGLFPFHRKGLEKSGAAIVPLVLSVSLLLLAVPQGLGLDGLRESGPGMVLCIGAGGHVALEPGLGGRCCSARNAIPAGDAGSLPEEGGFTGGNHCGRCIDLPLTGSGCPSLHPAGPRKPAPPGKAHSACPIRIPASPDIALAPSRPLEGAPREEKNRPAALLATVVLLI